MKTLNIKITIPKEIRELLKEYYTDKNLERELKEECQEFLWDIFHALKQDKANRKIETKKRVA
jgi:hypothetical protein